MNSRLIKLLSRFMGVIVAMASSVALSGVAEGLASVALKVGAAAAAGEVAKTAVQGAVHAIEHKPTIIAKFLSYTSKLFVGVVQHHVALVIALLTVVVLTVVAIFVVQKNK